MTFLDTLQHTRKMSSIKIEQVNLRKGKINGLLPCKYWINLVAILLKVGTILLICTDSIVGGKKKAFFHTNTFQTLTDSFRL